MKISAREEEALFVVEDHHLPESDHALPFAADDLRVLVDDLQRVGEVSSAVDPDLLLENVEVLLRQKFVDKNLQFFNFLKDPVRIQVTKLTRNITKDHLSEIFGTYGTVAHVEIPGGNGFSFSFRHQCFIEYESSEDAAKAAKYMDGGQIDGQEVMVTLMKGAPARNCSKNAFLEIYGGFFSCL